MNKPKMPNRKYIYKFYHISITFKLKKNEIKIIYI